MDDRILLPRDIATLVAGSMIVGLVGCIPIGPYGERDPSDESRDGGIYSDDESGRAPDDSTRPESLCFPSEGRSSDNNDSTADTGVLDPDLFGRDAGASDGTCGGRSCGAHATCRDGTCECASGYAGDPYEGCWRAERSCSSHDDCGSGATCIEETCTCDPGFCRRRGQPGCVRPSVGDPESRSKRELCRVEEAMSGPLTRQIWAEQPESQCDDGELSPKVHWEAVRTTNLYRWLIGLDPVATAKTRLEGQQTCATMMAANGDIEHDPPESWSCYSASGASAAGSSNLALGDRHPAATIPGYINERGASNRATLGHRRWIFSPGMGATAFGHRGRFGCMHSFDRSGDDPRSTIRYPTRGPFPVGALHGPWSYFETEGPFHQPQVDVTEVSTGESMAVDNVRSPSGTYGRIYGVSWLVKGAEAGQSYRIEISYADRNHATSHESSERRSISYTTELVSCE